MTLGPGWWEENSSYRNRCLQPFLLLACCLWLLESIYSWQKGDCIIRMKLMRFLWNWVNENITIKVKNGIHVHGTITGAEVSMNIELKNMKTGQERWLSLRQDLVSSIMFWFYKVVLRSPCGLKWQSGRGMVTSAWRYRLVLMNNSPYNREALLFLKYMMAAGLGSWFFFCSCCVERRWNRLE